MKSFSIIFSTHFCNGFFFMVAIILFFINKSKINSLKSVSVHIMLILFSSFESISKAIFCLRALILPIIFLYIFFIFWFLFNLFFSEKKESFSSSSFSIKSLPDNKFLRINNGSIHLFSCASFQGCINFSVSLNSSNTMRFKYDH